MFRPMANGCWLPTPITAVSRWWIPLREKPEGITWIGKGPLALVTVYREDRVAVINTQDGNVLQKINVAAEPYGIVANRAGTRAWLTHEYPGTVSELGLTNFKITREMTAGNFVRGLALSPDEQRLYVTEFYSAKLI